MEDLHYDITTDSETVPQASVTEH